MRRVPLSTESLASTPATKCPTCPKASLPRMDTPLCDEEQEGRWHGYLTQALQEGTRPRLGGTILFLALLRPDPPRQQKLWFVQVKHHPGESIVEVSPR